MKHTCVLYSNRPHNSAGSSTHPVLQLDKLATQRRDQVTRKVTIATVGPQSHELIQADPPERVGHQEPAVIPVFCKRHTKACILGPEVHRPQLGVKLRGSVRIDMNAWLNLLYIRVVREWTPLLAARRVRSVQSKCCSSPCAASSSAHTPPQPQ